MAFNRMSVATISSPEFINIQGISPFASKCEIKVFYLGKNRNGSFINKEVATNMAQTLPGCPIVGYYSEKKEDFVDHGDQMIIDGEGVKFKCLTTPYGFVAPNAKVWFQEFEDTDEFGNKELRTYLMTEGYLWTKQYEEARKVIDEGRPHSMELDEDTLMGYWSEDKSKGIDFFIINDAIFSKLCILGEDVEPCFEGSSVTAPKISSTFKKDDKFTRTLFTMMNELKELTLNDKGGNSMQDVTLGYVALDGNTVTTTSTDAVSVITIPATPPATDATVTITSPVAAEEKNNEISLATEDKKVLENNIEIENNIEDFTKNSDKKKEEEAADKEKKDGADSDKEEKESNNTGKENEDEEDKDKKKPAKNSLEEKFALLEQELADTKAELASIKEENASLSAFKAQIEDEKKDELINSFYMLSDEDKKSVIENKSKYTLDDIEKELSVICVRKKVNFNLDEEKATEKVAPTIFNLDSNMGDDLPAWLKAVEARKNAE